MSTTTPTPWLTLTESATYVRRGKRWVRKQVAQGRLRAAVVGGKRELLFRREWLDQLLEDLSTPVLVSMPRRRA